MGAIGIHHTGTSDGPWDGPANEARLKLDQDAEFYRRAYAWQDPDGDPSKKSTYRFIHHEVGSDGNPGAANLRACSTGIGVLNGGRGGTTIPAGDVLGVYRHLAAHLRDGDREPPELSRSAFGENEIERRVLPGTLEVRERQGQRPVIAGYAAVYGVLSEDLGGWRERILPGAFDEALEPVADVRALWQHEPAWVLGRTTTGTLRLSGDVLGLRFEVEPPETSWAADALVSLRRGDVSQMSFGFYVPQGGDSFETIDGMTVRSLRRVELLEVSPVTFAAYPATMVSVSLRAALRARGVRVDPDEGLRAQVDYRERVLKLSRL